MNWIEQKMRQARRAAVISGIFVAVYAGLLIWGIWTGASRWLDTALVGVVMLCTVDVCIEVNRWRFHRMILRAHQAERRTEAMRERAPWN